MMRALWERSVHTRVPVLWSEDSECRSGREQERFEDHDCRSGSRSMSCERERFEDHECIGIIRASV